MKSYKLIISLLLILAVMCSTTVVSVSAGTTYIRGDANCDNEVTIRDATIIQMYIANYSVPQFNIIAADVDGNGLNINDVTKIQKYLVGLNNQCQIGETVSDNTQPTQEEYELPFVPNK